MKRHFSTPRIDADPRLQRGRRRGTITHEAIMSVVIATAAIVGTAQILAVVSQQRRDVDRLLVASREAGNLLEAIAARPWSELTSAELSGLALSDECRAVLREPRLNVQVESDPSGISRRIRVEIDWLTSHEQRSLPLRLVAWRYPAKELDE